MDEKKCSRCKLIKPVTEFYKRGLIFTSHCKICKKLNKPAYKYEKCPNCDNLKRDSSLTCHDCSRNVRRPETEEFIADVKQKYESGLSSWKISAILGTNQRRIWKCLVRNDVKLRENSFINDGRLGKRSRQWRGHEEISGSFYGRIKAAARSRSIEFNVSIKDIWNVFIEQDRICPYTGIILTIPINNYEFVSGNYTASLDRVDSRKGYTIDNIEWVHRLINIMKSSLSKNEFILACTTVANNFKDYNNPEKDMNLMNYKIHGRKNVTE